MRYLPCLLLAATQLANGQPETPTVEVFVPPVTNRNLDMAIRRAETLAGEIFSQAGVQVRWRLARPPYRGCRREPSHMTVQVVFEWRDRAGLDPGTMAISHPYASSGACITVFMNRFNLTRTEDTAAMLGHVLAHEIGHVVQAVARHSETGVLKAHWSAAEVVNMTWKPLRFTEYDVKLMLQGLAGRKLTTKTDPPAEPAPTGL